MKWVLDSQLVNEATKSQLQKHLLLEQILEQEERTLESQGLEQKKIIHDTTERIFWIAYKQAKNCHSFCKRRME